jgi:hypothetical protein
MKAYYLSLKPETPCNSYWDYTFLNDFLTGKMWKPPQWQDFETKEVSKLPKGDRAIVVLPARHHADMVEQVNKEIKKINRIVLFLMGDEEADFPVEKIEHSNIEIWVQNPHPDRHDKYNKLGTGYAPIPKMDYEAKTVDVFFSGQLTHRRRFEMYEQLQQYGIKIGNADINGSKGFTQGFEPKVYFDRFRKARIAPAPSGAVIPDSFRLHEAMEMMAVPIADDENTSGTITEYWNWIYPDAPFPRIKRWVDFIGYTQDINKDYPHIVHKITQWWITYKRDFAYKVLEQLNA